MGQHACSVLGGSGSKRYGGIRTIYGLEVPGPVSAFSRRSERDGILLRFLMKLFGLLFQFLEASFGIYVDGILCDLALQIAC